MTVRKRLLIVGLEEPEVELLRERLDIKLIACEMLPRLRLWQGRLTAESPDRDELYLPISHVIFHGIYEDDLPFLSALALWGGPCFPRARGMLDCRLRVPCLVRALEVTQYGGLARGFADRGTVFEAEQDCVAKWGEWHCGENKERFTGTRIAEMPTLFEAFAPGEAVRIQLVGEQAWQFHLGGADWKKSIHDPTAALTALDPALLDDARRLQRHFGLEILGVDYIVADDGSRYLLEVNHIPTVTAFREVREAYLDEVVKWLKQLAPP